MAHTLFELDVRLREIEPPIWRTIEISGASTLEAVHFAIQVAMGWTNSHLHQFVIGKTHYGMADVDEDLELEDERNVRLQDLVRNGETFVYEYDFGDGWEHDVRVTKVTVQAKVPKPRCTGGARACPPEDCGGAHGYAHLLEVLRDPNHEEHESAVTWSSNFQPERFTRPRGDLERSMRTLEALAEQDDDLEEGETLDLPQPIVQAALALDPMQRASLAALLSASLATELVELRGVTERLVGALDKRPKRHGRGRAR